MSNKIIWTVHKADGTIRRAESKNLRTNDGINWQAQVMGNLWGDVSITTNTPHFLSITTHDTAPVVGDSDLVSEQTLSGLSRATGTFSHTADASSYTLTASWQYTGTSTITIRKAAMASAFTDTGLSSDTHFVITLVSPVAVLDSNDTLEIAWGIFYAITPWLITGYSAAQMLGSAIYGG